MKAILRTWIRETPADMVVEIDDTHDFALGPYQDSVPFAVGSNQEILQIETQQTINTHNT